MTSIQYVMAHNQLAFASATQRWCGSGGAGHAVHVDHTIWQGWH